jgi:hypothetical protein
MEIRELVGGMELVSVASTWAAGNLMLLASTLPLRTMPGFRGL